MLSSEVGFNLREVEFNDGNVCHQSCQDFGLRDASVVLVLLQLIFILPQEVSETSPEYGQFFIGCCPCLGDFPALGG